MDTDEVEQQTSTPGNTDNTITPFVSNQASVNSATASPTNTPSRSASLLHNTGIIPLVSNANHSSPIPKIRNLMLRPLRTGDSSSSITTPIFHKDGKINPTG